jgi:beta-phosphoglucomutase-like phosphatase (HAD superfamily)
VALSAVVFDFDGVIANSEPLHFRAFREILGEQGIDLSEQEYYGRYLGFDDAGVFAAAATDHGLTWNARMVARLVSAKAIRIEALERDISVLFPEADAAVERIAAAVPLAIASGALGGEIRRVLTRTGLLRYFVTIVGAEDTPVSKPAADPYRLAAARLSAHVGRPLDPATIVAVEDSPWGLQSARAAGLKTAAIAQTYDAKALDADLVIQTIGELEVAALERLCT